MSLTALIRKRTSGRLATAISAISATQAGSAPESVARIATIAVANSQEAETVAPDPAAEDRRQRVLAMLRERPTVRYAVVTDTDSDPDAVIVALAVRGRATCEILVPRAKWDGMLFIDLLDKHCEAVH